MQENVNIAAEIISAIISTAIGTPLAYGGGLVKRKIERRILLRRIKKREAYLKKKYEKNFELLNKMDKGSFYEWLKEKRTIGRILSFSNAEDVCNISAEQMRHSRESFFKDAFYMAQIHDLREKEELRTVLNDLFAYVDELFWNTLDEKNVFLYKKCVLEIRESIRELTEDIIQEIQYHGSFAEYIDNQKVLQEVPFKLDYRSGEIPFVGRIKELKEIDAFCDSQEQISWWAVIGKGGSGKSRLAYQYIKNNIGSSDWKMLFLQDEFFSQVNGGGKYKNWHIWTYDKNLLFVIDYVQKYAKEVSQWIEELSRNNSITRKIRILLLERTDGERALWMKEGFEKPLLDSLKYKRGFLKLQSLDSDLIQFATEYAKKNKKRISESEAVDAWNRLKTIDSDTRILYFIMILEAVLNNEPWREWNRSELADYIVRREQEGIGIRFKADAAAIRSFNRLLAFCTATKELPFFELPQGLPEPVKKEINVIENHICGKDELCAVMQLEDGILQPVTPDIIGEYMVLHILEQYFWDKGEKEKFIRDLWAYDSESFLFFVYRLIEDKMDSEPYEDIIKLMLFDAVPYDNLSVTEAYSNLMWGLTAIRGLEQTLIFIKTLEKIYREYPSDKVIVCSYAKGLFNLSNKQEQSERKETIGRLEELAAANANNGEIQSAYAKGLFNLSNKQERPERKETIGRLEELAAANANNGEIQTAYAKGLFNLSCAQEQPERNETIGRLEELAAANADNGEIQTEYAKGLVNLSCIQEPSERKETIRRLEELAAANANNGEILAEYAQGLFNLSCAQEQPERKETIGRLEELAAANVDNGEIQTEYAKGLVNLSCIQEPSERKETIRRLEELAAANANNGEIQAEYAKGLFNLSCPQEQPEIKETIRRLEELAVKNVSNGEIQSAYAKGLFNLSCGQEQPERNETIGRLEELAAANADNGEIQSAYAKGLVNLSNEQEQPEIKETIRRLEELAAANANNGGIQSAYAKGLFNLSCEQEQPEIKETIRRLEALAAANAGNKEIQMIYAACCDTIK